MIIPHRSKPHRVRVVVVSGDGDRVLLSRRARPGRTPVWAPPGIALDAGRDAVRAAAALLARLGLPDAEPGPVARRRRVSVAAGGELEDHREDLFVVRTDHCPQAATDSRWCALAELDGLPDPVYPSALAELVAESGSSGT